MRTKHIWLMALITGLFVQTAQASVTPPRVIPLDHIVAVVNDGVILNSELNEYLNTVINQMRGQNAAMPDMSALAKQGLDRLILRSLQLQRAKKTGIQVDDATLNRSIQGIARKNGMNLQQFRNALLADNMDYDDRVTQ